MTFGGGIIRHTGKIRALFTSGFGFITPDDSAVDPAGRGVFFHARDLRGDYHEGRIDTLTCGTEVEFELLMDERGRRAAQIRVVKLGDGEGPRERRKVRG